MASMNTVQTTDIPLNSPPTDVPPALSEGELYHVFISYSSTDYSWAHSLIERLESCNLQVCYHERDFTPGRSVLENMSECIQDSQKVLLVLSPDFVRSRWCLLEANMSMFRDCLERKPIVPVMLVPGVSVPLHLCHLTYLEASDPAFRDKLLKVLCTPNRQLQGSTVVPYQPPSIYNGKALQPLTAVDSEDLEKWDAGHFSDMEVPDQLRLVIEDHEKYKEAVRIINRVAEGRRLKAFIVLLIVFGWIIVICLWGSIILYEGQNPDTYLYFVTFMVCVACLVVSLLIQSCLTRQDCKKHIVSEMQRAAGRANAILCEEKVLMGCSSNKQLHLVYVSLDGCKREFAETFSEWEGVEEMFQRAVRYFSSGYTCCLAKRHFPFRQSSSAGHLEGGVCFCQYVSHQLSRGEWN